MQITKELKSFFSRALSLALPLLGWRGLIWTIEEYDSGTTLASPTIVEGKRAY